MSACCNHGQSKVDEESLCSLPLPAPPFLPPFSLLPRHSSFFPPPRSLLRPPCFFLPVPLLYLPRPLSIAPLPPRSSLAHVLLTRISLPPHPLSLIAGSSASISLPPSLPPSSPLLTLSLISNASGPQKRPVEDYVSMFDMLDSQTGSNLRDVSSLLPSLASFIAPSLAPSGPPVLSSTHSPLPVCAVVDSLDNDEEIILQLEEMTHSCKPEAFTVSQGGEVNLYGCDARGKELKEIFPDISYETLDTLFSLFGDDGDKVQQHSREVERRGSDPHTDSSVSPERGGT